LEFPGCKDKFVFNTSAVKQQTWELLFDALLHFYHQNYITGFDQKCLNKQGILWDASLKFKNLQNHVFQSWYLLLQVKFPGSTLQEYDATETVAAPTRASGMHLTCICEDLVQKSTLGSAVYHFPKSCWLMAVEKQLSFFQGRSKRSKRRKQRSRRR